MDDRVVVVGGCTVVVEVAEARVVVDVVVVVGRELLVEDLVVVVVEEVEGATARFDKPVELLAEVTVAGWSLYVSSCGFVKASLLGGVNGFSQFDDQL